MPRGACLLPQDRPALLIHGGAWAIPFGETAAHLDGLHAAASLGAERLASGAPAETVVVEVVSLLEDHTAFDAGHGAVLNRAGEVELDAGLMSGATLTFGAVAGVRRIANPIRVAYELMVGDGQERLLVADGADAFARTRGLALVENGSLIVDRERRRYQGLQAEVDFHTSAAFLPGGETVVPGDTVGCVARDIDGRLAAGTSTGGTPFTHPGRVGDSPLPGCGFYADEHAAVSATGWGEAIASVVLAARTADRVAAGVPPDEAASEALTRMEARVRNPRGRGARGGLIVLDRHGNGGWAFTSPRMARAGWQEGGSVWTAL